MQQTIVNSYENNIQTWWCSVDSTTMISNELAALHVSVKDKGKHINSSYLFDFPLFSPHSTLFAAIFLVGCMHQISVVPNASASA